MLDAGTFTKVNRQETMWISIFAELKYFKIMY